MTITPTTEISQLSDLGMLMLNVIFDRETSWIVYSNVAAKSEKDA
jgi:hypothetical protein